MLSCYGTFSSFFFCDKAASNQIKLFIINIPNTTVRITCFRQKSKSSKLKSPLKIPLTSSDKFYLPNIFSEVIYAYICMSNNAYLYVYMCICVCIYIHTYVCVCVYICLCSIVYIYIYIYIQISSSYSIYLTYLIDIYV